MKRVVITGMGAVTPFGVGADALWESVKAGRNGVDVVTRIDVSDMPTKVAAEVRDFNPSDYIDKKDAKRMDRFTQYAFVAALLAYKQSGLRLEDEDLTRAGVIMGSGIGGLETLEEQHKLLLGRGPGRVSPFFIPMMIANMASGQLAIQYGFKGFNESVNTACSSGTNAIGDAFQVIREGRADIMLAGGSEAAVTPMAFAGFCAMKAMTTNPDPETAKRPFDAGRNGFVLGEGAGVIMLEEYERAKARGAPILGEIAGYGCTDDAFHIVAPAEGGEGAARCMKLALDDAGVEPASIGYINAHGTSTDYNDKYESSAIRQVFGSHADVLCVSSTKSMTGHLLGATGAVEVIITCCALSEGYLPPTIHYSTPDKDCDLDYIPNTGRVADGIDYAISNTFGFGGHNATLVMKKIGSDA
ncbi:MAG: beta-ketoacyl-ACP synthase II [Oscillospiraceae bacterium]|nr:beta-ketoacyl-ACP synthase II [Oscillospiraceae bacterium]